MENATKKTQRKQGHILICAVFAKSEPVFANSEPVFVNSEPKTTLHGERKTKQIIETYTKVTPKPDYSRLGLTS